MVIKVERGNPTPEELAAVIALVQARAAAAAEPADGPRAADEWASRRATCPAGCRSRRRRPGAAPTGRTDPRRTEMVRLPARA